MPAFLIHALLLFLLPAAVALAQPTGLITGNVTDEVGDPLPGANVIIEGTALGTATDIDGNYLIIGVPVGTYSVTASRVGYPAQTYEGVRAGANVSLRLDFDLGGLGAWSGIRVRWEAPLLVRDPFASRALSGEDIERLPVGR